MMRDCPEGDLRDALPLLAHGKLAGAERARVEAHVAECATCAAELDLLRAVARAYDVARIDSATIVAALPVARARRESRPFHRQPLWQLAASLTLMIAGTATVMLVQRRAMPDRVATVASIDSGAAATPAGSTAVQASAQATTDKPAAALGFGVSLSDLTDAQLETLLSSIERIEGRVSADPEVMAKPIVPTGTATTGKRN